MQYIYHYHPETSVYLGQEVADESPLEPGVYLVPAHATLVPPPNDPLPPDFSYVWSVQTNTWLMKRKPSQNNDHNMPQIPEVDPIAQKWEELRFIRNSMLQETDYLFMRDYILTPEQDFKWRTYRTALRDLPKNTTDIDNPPWPQPPY